METNSPSLHQTQGGSFPAYAVVETSWVLSCHRQTDGGDQTAQHLDHYEGLTSFTPTYGSWMNLVERWFSALTTKKVQRSAHDSVAELAADITDWVERWNEDPKSFLWHATSDEILERLARYRTANTSPKYRLFNLTGH